MFGYETSSYLPEVAVNWWAILAATAVAMIIGSLWYGPLFGNRWMKLVGLKKKDTENGWQVPMLTMLAMAFVQAIIVRHIIVYAAYFNGGMDLGVGLATGFWLFVGVALPLVLSSNMFARRSMDLTYIEAGNQLATLLAIGAILSTWE